MAVSIFRLYWTAMYQILHAARALSKLNQVY